MSDNLFDQRRASRRIALFALLSTVAGLSINPAQAQSADEEASDQSGDIVVTALKRKTNLQDTPISIGAVTGEALANAQATTIADLTATTPGLNLVDAGPSQRRVVIRGIQAAGEPTVGTYYDETPVTGVVGAANDAGGSTPELRLFDVDRVEVLRGPQGTLYGSGSMGGTLRVIYAKPDFESTAAINAALSTTRNGGANYDVSAMVNVPIVDDKIAVRAVGFYAFNNGYIDNTTLGIKNINDRENYGGRILLRATPTERLTIDLAAYFNRTTSDTDSWNKALGKYNADFRTRLPLLDELQLYSATAVWDAGPVTLTAVGSYLDRRLDVVASDVTRFIASNRTPARCQALVSRTTPCTPAQLTTFFAFVDSQIPSALFPQQDQGSYTAEVRLSSNWSGPFKATIGGFYSDRETDVENPQVTANPLTGEAITNVAPITVRFVNDELKQIAAFGELSFDITPRLNVTGGLRYFKYTKDVAGRTPIGNPLVGATVTPLTRVNSEEDGVVSKFNVSWKASDDILLYAVAAQGFRPGGVNQVIGLPANLAPYRSDSLWNYEAGIKTSFWDRRLTFNLDVFRIDWKDIQITGRTANGAFAFITNAGAAKVTGVEMDGTVRPVPGLSISGNLTFLNATLTENQTSAAVTAPGLAGDRIPFIPRTTAGFAIDYETPVSDTLSILFHVDGRAAGKSLSDFRPAGAFTRRIEAYELVNARIGIESGEGHWGAYLFATNLFDDTAITRANSSAILVGRTIVNSANPQTFGINVRTKF